LLLKIRAIFALHFDADVVPIAVAPLDHGNETSRISYTKRALRAADLTRERETFGNAERLDFGLAPVDQIAPW